MTTSFKSKTLNSKTIEHGFFTRHNGCSSGLYRSMNCSYNVGDLSENVSNNLEIIRRYMNADAVFTVNQVHGKKVVLVDKDFDVNKYNHSVDADAIVTTVPRICLGIVTADCAPVLLHDVLTNTVAALHCGWKSARFGVIENSISLMQNIANSSANIRAAIGPCVHVKNYMVQEDFISQFTDEPWAKECFVRYNDEIHFDLILYVKLKLSRLGIKSIDIVDQDTVSNQDDFFSFRIAKSQTSGVCGRQISCIMIK